jgi:hypothetical protein
MSGIAIFIVVGVIASLQLSSYSVQSSLCCLQKRSLCHVGGYHPRLPLPFLEDFLVYVDAKDANIQPFTAEIWGPRHGSQALLG